MTVHDSKSLGRRGEQQTKTAITFLVLAWVFLALRIWTRVYIIANFGWDDGTMIFATMVFTVFCASMLYLEAHGGGTHISDVAALIHLTQWAIVGEATYLITVMAMKISLGIFFARIVVKRHQLWAIYVTVAVTVLSSSASFLYCLLRCGANLNMYVPRQLENKCTPRGLDRFFAYQQAAVTTLTDCILAALPIFILWHTSMDLRTKLSVGFILSLAASGCICSMIRFRYVDGLTQIEDFFWASTNVAIWSTIEQGAGIVAGCMATLRPFVKQFLTQAQSLRSSTSRSAKGSSRFAPSNQNSSNRKSQSTTKPGETSFSTTRRSTLAECNNTQQQTFELKSDLSRHNESTDNILETTEYIHRSPAQQDRNHGQEQACSHTTRSRRASDGFHLNRPLPPIPPVPPNAHKRSI